MYGVGTVSQYNSEPAAPGEAVDNLLTMYGYTREGTKTTVRGVVQRHWIVKNRKGEERFRLYRKSPLSKWIEKVNWDQKRGELGLDFESYGTVTGRMNPKPWPPLQNLFKTWTNESAKVDFATIEARIAARYRK